MLNGDGVILPARREYKCSVLSLALVDIIKFYVPPAPKLPGEEESSEEAGTSLPGQEPAEEEDVEEEEGGTLKDPQRVLEKGQGRSQQLEGNDMMRLELLAGGEEWIVASMASRL